MAETAHDGVIDHEARALSNQALQRVQADAKLNEERWENNTRRFDEAGRAIQRQFDEIRLSFSGMRTDISGQLALISGKLDSVDRLYNSRWWQLAVALIAILLSISGFLAVKTIFHG